MIVRVGHLYPEYLNIYADRGNIAVLQRRAGARGHELELEPVTLGTSFEPGMHDLLYVGGGQDREQAMIAADLAVRGDDLRAAVDGGAALLAVCGGYQLLGRGYRGRDGAWMAGAGLFPHETLAGETRMIGDVLLASTLPEAAGKTIAGFENHAGRTMSTSGRNRSAASSQGMETTEARASRAAAWDVRSGRTSTAHSYHATPGSPISCCHGLSPTRPAPIPSRSRPSTTRSRTRPTPSPQPGRAPGAAVPPESLGPTGPEVHAGVAGLVPRQEARDRGVQRDAVELVEREQPVAPYRLVARA